MKRIYGMLTAAVLLISSACFAEWRQVPKYDNEEKIEDYLAKTHREFILPEKKSKNGLILFALDSNISSWVELRYNKENIDFKVNLISELSSKPVKLFLILLDEDMFPIQRVFIDDLTGKYKGECFGHFSMKWEKFSQVKYYAFDLRV